MGLVLLCIILFAIIVVGIIFHFKKSNSVSPTNINETLQVYKLDCMSFFKDY